MKFYSQYFVKNARTFRLDHVLIMILNIIAYLRLQLNFQKSILRICDIATTF